MNIRVLGTVALLLLVPIVAHSGSLSTAKPVAELNLMTDGEIRAEAYDACAQASIDFTFGNYSHELVEAEAYLKLLGRVARQRNNGVEPPWVQQAHQAYQQLDSGKTCRKVFAADFGAVKQKSPQHQGHCPDCHQKPPH